jgi:hypothetical protein
MILFIDSDPDFINPTIDILCLVSDIKKSDVILCTDIDSAISVLNTHDITAICMEALLPKSDLVGSLYSLNGLNLLKYIRGMFRQNKGINFNSIPITLHTLLSSSDGRIMENAEVYNAGFICKTDFNSVEKLVEFFKSK